MFYALVGLTAFLLGWFVAIAGAKGVLRQAIEAHMDAAEHAGADPKRYTRRLMNDSRVDRKTREKLMAAGAGD